MIKESEELNLANEEEVCHDKLSSTSSSENEMPLSQSSELDKQPSTSTLSTTMSRQKCSFPDETDESDIDESSQSEYHVHTPTTHANCKSFLEKEIKLHNIRFHGFFPNLRP